MTVSAENEQVILEEAAEVTLARSRPLLDLYLAILTVPNWLVSRGSLNCHLLIILNTCGHSLFVAIVGAAASEPISCGLNSTGGIASLHFVEVLVEACIRVLKDESRPHRDVGWRVADIVILFNRETKLLVNVVLTKVEN